MNRCLHITINENPGAEPESATPHLPDQDTSDPGGNITMPPPDGLLTYPPDSSDPSARGLIARVAAGKTVQTSSGACFRACSCACACGCAAQAGSSPAGTGGSTAPIPGVTARDYSGFVIVRLAAGIKDTVAENLWTLAKLHQPELTGLEAVLELPISTAKQSQKAAPEAVEPLTPPAAPGRVPATGTAIVTSPVVPPPQPPPGTLVSQPLVNLPGLRRSDCLERIGGLEGHAATSVFPPLHSLTSYWRVGLRQHSDLVDEVVKRLNALAEVDLAYRELTATDPQAAGQTLAEDQGYLADAPVGISASWAWKSITPTTPKVTICDLEQGWITGHQDLNDQNGGPLVKVNGQPVIVYGDNRASNDASFGFHGTAVSGILAATGQSPFGVTGATDGRVSLLLASHYRKANVTTTSTTSTTAGTTTAPAPDPFADTNGHVAVAIVQALVQAGNQGMKAGDILLLEVQRALLPTEVDEADFDAIRLASAQGVIVVEAAGNGGVDLDSFVVAETGRSLNRASTSFGDSGAILVGAARAALPHDRAFFSNYGSRLDCYGWGEAVTTCGYGDLAGTVVTNFYTNVFDGTSSASPIIAGAAALVQALYSQAGSTQSQSGTVQPGPWLDPRALRSLLSDPNTGTRQGPNVAGFIGVMPDLRAIVRGNLGLVADIYMRRHVGDDGSPLSPGDEISSSPDILIWQRGAAPAIARFGEGIKANTPAPGSLLNTSTLVYPNDVYVRLRNRGGSADKTKIQLFASPAATLITPERWLPLGFIDVPTVPPGDTLLVSAPLAGLNLPSLWPQSTTGWPTNLAALWPGTAVPPYSLLAVQVSPNAPTDLPASLQRPTPLPPGPPYFDWAKARSFLRGPGVAWRNAYPIAAGSASTTLPFLIAGTPDQSRHFDFEMIQRLPAGAKVTLAVPDALAAKLRQRQPLLGTASPLALPLRPRTAIRGVQLAAEACSPAAFTITITAGNSPLATGHSLAIRQIWKGEEVGRITWWFVDAADPEAD